MAGDDKPPANWPFPTYKGRRLPKPKKKKPEPLPYEPALW